MPGRHGRARRAGPLWPASSCRCWWRWSVSRLGRDWEQDLRAASAALAPRRDALVAPGGLPEELARRIGRTFPLVYGSSGIGAVAARWWKDEVNRNAKSPAFAAELPDLTYGELAGWGQSGDVTRQVLTLIELRHGGESQRTADLFAAVTAATDEVMADVLRGRGHRGRRPHPLLRPGPRRPAGLAAPGGPGGRGPRAHPGPRRRARRRGVALDGRREERPELPGSRLRSAQLRRSTIMAMPWPPPTHMDSRPMVLPVSSSALSSVVMMRAPV